jgi:hypothetical protein
MNTTNPTDRTYKVVYNMKGSAGFPQTIVVQASSDSDAVLKQAINSKLGPGFRVGSIILVMEVV